jgi:hypothetical protein
LRLYNVKRGKRIQKSPPLYLLKQEKNPGIMDGFVSGK